MFKINKSSFALLFLAALLFGVTAARLVYTTDLPQIQTGAASVPALQTVRAVKGLPSLEDLSATLIHPIFAQDRSAAQSKADVLLTSRQRDELTGYRLQGTIIDEVLSSALFFSPKAHEMLEVFVGDTIAGWTTTHILPNSVVLTKGEQRKTFSLSIENFQAGRSGLNALLKRTRPSQFQKNSRTGRVDGAAVIAEMDG